MKANLGNILVCVLLFTILKHVSVNIAVPIQAMGTCFVHAGVIFLFLIKKNVFAKGATFIHNLLLKVIFFVGVMRDEF